MRLLDWFKRLKWIKAIRGYDFLYEIYQNAVANGFKLQGELRATNREISDLKRRIDGLKDQNRRLKENASDVRIQELQAILCQHRMAAQTAIKEAEKERRHYLRRLEELDAKN